MSVDDLPETLGQVDPKSPLLGLEHVNVIPRDVVLLSAVHADKDDLSWTDLKSIIDSNHLEQLKRRPHDLRNYLRWKHYIEKTRMRGGVLEFMVSERLLWVDEEHSSESELKVLGPVNKRFLGDVKQDVKILKNDFPYAMQPGIVHVVVWTKTAIPIDSSTGDLTPESKSLIQKYVDATFSVLFKDLAEAKANTLWFKNWAALQSIPALSHFHVLLNHPNIEKLQKLYGTGGVQIDI